jgi:dipeptidyl aminopeptidase/acylaminoacyl peptidase
MSKLLSVFLLFAVLITSAQAKTNHLSIESFSKATEFDGVKLSPDGKYLAVITRPEGKKVLMILDVATFKPMHAVQFPGNGQVGNYNWVNNERIVLAKEYLRGWKEQPEYHGELFGVNADGSQGKYLVGYQGEMQTGSNIKKAASVRGTSFVLDPLLSNRRKMLVYTIPWTASNEPNTIVYEVDVYKGHRKRVVRSPAKMAGFLTDNDGNVRVAVSNENYIDQSIYTRGKSGGKWTKLDLGGLPYGDVNLRAFDDSGDSVYVTASQAGEAEGLYKLNLNTKKFELLHKDKFVSPKRVWVDEVSKELFAIEHELGYPTYSFVGGSSQKSAYLKALLQSLKGNQVQLVSSTLDGSVSVIYASSDTNPGDYYLFDSTQNNLRFLFSSRSWIKPHEMAITKPINYTARDGLTIHGYLTVPNNMEEENMPLVVMPHGGPHGIRDWWGYDPDAQLLANRGIAVLKINFRGSGGFGRNFEHTGHLKWGSEIQFDIIDGVKDLINKGTVDKDNICIMGASFGGYSALQSAIIEPDMFKCAIGVVGVYDLPLMFDEGDIAEQERGQRYLERAIGTNQEKLKQFSPSYNIDKLKAPVLIVHGGEDRRAPIEQAESLVTALKKYKHPYIYELLEDEGHGFYKEEHRSRYYKQVLSFLEQHMSF